MKNSGIYGVRRRVGDPSPALERVCDSAGLTARVGVGGQRVQNDFDQIFPWGGFRRCNLGPDGRVRAYFGEPGYRSDGEGGQVMVEIPRFYQLHLEREGWEYWLVSPCRQEGFRLSPAFLDARGQPLEHIYIGAYLCAPDGRGGVISAAGRYGRIRTDRPTWRGLCRNLGPRWGMMDAAFLCDVLQLLFTVEFATLNSQSVMTGLTDLPYSAESPLLLSEQATNRAVVAEGYARQFRPGQGIALGWELGDNRVVPHAAVTGVTPLGGGRAAVSFDGPPADLEAGMLLYSSLWVNGGADGVAASSGAAFADPQGQAPILWRGIENPYGNTWEWIDGINILDLRPYVCTDPGAYSDCSITGAYRMVSYCNSPTDESPIVAWGEDPRLPFARFPTRSGEDGGPERYCGDFYWQRPGLRAVIFGGSWYNGRRAGIYCFSGWSAPEMIHVNTGARLLYR